MDAVVQWILQGGREIDIRDAIAQYYPDENAESLIQAAVHEIRLDGAIDQQTVYGFCFLQAKRLMLKMEKVGDNAGALNALKLVLQIAKTAPPPPDEPAPVTPAKSSS